MPIDFTKPTTSGNYSTGVLQPINDAMKALAQWLDPAVAGTLTSTPTGAYRLNTGAVERFNGTSWVAQPINGINYSAGLVAIGSTAPQNLFEIAGDSSPRLAIRAKTETVGNNPALGFHVNHGVANASTNGIALITAKVTQADPNPLKGDLGFSTNTGDSVTEKMILDSDGSLFLGAAKKAWVSGKALQVSALAFDGNTTLGGEVAYNAYRSGTTTWSAIATGTSSRMSMGGGLFTWWSGASAAADAAITWTRAMDIDSSANLVPGANNARNLGSTSLRWSNVYALAVDIGGYEAVHAGNLPVVHRNRIHNGDFKVCQRIPSGADTLSFSGVHAGGKDFYGLVADRWRVTRYNTSGPNLAVSICSAGTNGRGTANSYKIQVSGTGAAPASASYNVLMQAIPGADMIDVGMGTAQAKSLTLSFWVKSSLTGAFSVVVGSHTSGTDASYVTTFNVNTSGTWEYKTISIPANTAGPKGGNYFVFFDLGSGSTWTTSSLNTWLSTSGYLVATSATKLVGTTSAYLELSDIQLEVGSTATPFARRSFADELQICQQFFSTSYNYGDFAVAGKYDGAVTKSPDATCSYMSFGHIKFPTTLCPGVPLLGISTPRIWNPVNGQDNIYGRNINTATDVVLSVYSYSHDSMCAYVNNQSVAAGQLVAFHYSIEAEPDISF